MLHPIFRRSIAELIAIAALALVISPSELLAGDQQQTFKAKAVLVLDGSGTMYQHKNYYLTQSSGPVGKEGIPRVIRLGDVVEVKGKRIKVNHIIVTHYLADMRSGGNILARAGDIKCVIVETEKDLPYSEGSRDRLWINVEKCQPIQ